MKKTILYLEINALKERINCKERKSPVDMITLVRIENMEKLPNNVMTVNFKDRIVYYRK